MAMISSFLPEAFIQEIKISCTGDREAERDSFVDVKLADIFSSDGLPKRDGVYDSHMGSTEVTYLCSTCQNHKEYCPGHAGIIKANAPIQSPFYMKAILQFLRFICLECGELVINISANGGPYGSLVKYVSSNSTAGKSDKKMVCLACGVAHPKISRDKYENYIIYKHVETTRGVERVRIHNAEIKQIFDRIKPHTLAKLHHPLDCHPSKYIWSSIHVPSITIRPANRRLSSKNGINDITTMLKHIVTKNQEIEPIDAKTKMTDEQELNADILQLLVYTMIYGVPSSSKTKKIKVINTSKKPPEAIAMRYPQKAGRPRQNLNGRRVGKAARGVISCDPPLEIDQLGVPLLVAKTIQIPTRCHPWNFDELHVYFKNGEKGYPGCTKIYKHLLGKTYDVSSLRPDITLEVGDILERDLIDGDPVAFNRNPSLTPANITSHKCVVRPESNTFSFNVSNCERYNADFDGDEMNAYFPASHAAQIEADIMLSIGVNMISHQYSKPMLGLFQDSLIMVAMFTKGEQFFDRAQAMQLFAGIPIKMLASLDLNFDNKRYSNYDIMTMVLPDINFTAKPEYFKKHLAHIVKYDERDIKVVIKDGVYYGGILDSASVGQTTSGSIIHIIKNKFGSKRAVEFVYIMQRIVENYCYLRGFTLGIEDVMVSDAAIGEILQTSRDILAKSELITDQLIRGEIIKPIGFDTVAEYYEKLQTNALSAGDEFHNIVINDINHDTNAMFNLAHTGSKGSVSNTVQVSSSLGQQKLGGNRMPKTFGMRRTLPYFRIDDMSARANGYVIDSYISGLDLPAFIFNSMDARYSLIMKALSTSVAGEQDRTSIKNLESARVTNTQMVSKGQYIMQYIYGESGFDPRSLETNTVELVNLSDADFAKYHVKVATCANQIANSSGNGATATQKLLDAEFAQLSEDRLRYREIMLTIEKYHSMHNKLYGNKIKSPVNCTRIINNIILIASNGGVGNSTNAKLNIEEALTDIRESLDKMPFYAFNVNMDRMPPHWAGVNALLNIYIRSYLNVRTLLDKKISNKMLKAILENITLDYSNAFIDYGTAAGIIAAKSICQPLTQYVIDAHHRAGGASTKTDKLVRVAEVFNVRPTASMNKPTMHIVVKDTTDIVDVQRIANKIEMIQIDKFITSDISVFYEKIGEIRHPDFIHENAFIAKFFKNNPTMTAPTDLINYCIRFELDKKTMMFKNISLNDIIEAINVNFTNKLFPVYTPENDDSHVIILRLYLRDELTRKLAAVSESILSLVETLIASIRNMVIRGIKDIKGTTIIQNMKTVVMPDGSMVVQKANIIETQGTNLSEVLLDPAVDGYNTMSDSLREVAEVFGIEAARQMIITEIKGIHEATIVTKQAHAHFTIYADEMTRTGELTPIQRTGLAKREREKVLLRLSTSNPKEVIESASSYGEIDPMQDLSSQIMIGQRPRYGTLYNDVVLNEDFVAGNTEDLEDILADI